MMTEVQELQAGDVLELGGATATLIVTTPHPWYNSGFALVVWWLHAEQRYTFDALLWRQELLGRVVRGPFGPVNRDVRERAWREATKGGQL
jgi:hypothetical protein